MSPPTPGASRRAVLRGVVRGVLAIGGAALLTGCDPIRRHHTAVPSATASIDAPTAALRKIIADERRLLERYDTVLATHPALRTRLDPIRSDHDAHLKALLSLPGALSPEPARTSPPTPPDDVTSLMRAELAAAHSLAAGCLLQRPEAAILLASIAASEASHAAVLA